MPRIRRRKFLHLSAAAAAASTLPVGCVPPDDAVDAGAGPPQRPDLDPDEYDGGERVAFDAESITLDADEFALGVQAGGMKAEGALLWGYATSASARTLRVWREVEGESDVVIAYDREVEPDANGYFRVDVDGLAPATWYSYALFEKAGDELVARSDIGRVMPAYPDDWKWPVSVAAATCTHFENQPYQALSRMAGEEFEVIVHLGDMSYNDGANTAEEYRAKWAQTLGDDGYRDLLSKAGMYITWDDHEFTNNLNPETVDPVQLATARDAFFQSLPAERGEADRLWTSYRWGHTVEFFVLDARTERVPSTIGTDEAVYLGREQMDWFKAGLKDSPCHFKVVLNSVPMTAMSDLWSPALGDRWEGYTSAREELLGFLEENDLDNVYFLSGDFHVGFVARLEGEGFRKRLWEIAVGPSGNALNPLSIIAGLSDEGREQVYPSAQFLYGGGQMASTVLTFDPFEDAVRVKFVAGDDGEVLFDDVISRES